jgi:intracellular sulfur oxidation DsrE/DsrF family protein
MVKAAIAGVSSGMVLPLLPRSSDGVEAASVPNNFRAIVHITRQEDFTYAFSSLAIIAQKYKKATGRLLIDGAAVTSLTDDDVLTQLKSASDAGAEILAASDALSINNIDPSSLPDFIEAKNPGVIAIVDAQINRYHYMKL